MEGRPPDARAPNLTKEQTFPMTSGTSIPSAAAGGTFTIGGDLSVRRMGYGAMRITGQGIWGLPPNRETARAVLRRALELGVTLIDTADAYGPNVSEELIAEALYPYPPGLVIATKGGLVRPGPGEWVPDGRPNHLRDALQGSLRRLRLERIDLYQFHRPDPIVPWEDSIGTLAELRAAGQIRHIGLSNVSPEQLAAAQRIVPIVSVQNRYNLLDRAAERVLALCEQQDLAFLPWRPTGEGNQPRELGAIAQRHHASPAQITLAWLLQRSPVILPIPGTGSVAHLEENVAAASIQLSDDEMRELSRLAPAAS